tara:strand:+ start:1728 stop:2213 length:486 start_codon:yes stop_codon:yes gene_type:complete
MKKSKKTKITKRSKYYQWIDDVRANVKIYPCEHQEINYKALQKLQEKTWDELRLAEKKIEELQVQLGECVEQTILNNHSWEKKYERMAKLYIGYKRKYFGLFGLKQSAESMGIDTENYKATEEDKKVMKDYTFKQKETQLESGRIKSQFFLTKRKKKNGKV